MSKEEKRTLKQGESKNITKTSEGDDKDFKASGIEVTKDAAPELREEIARLKAENAAPELREEITRLKAENAKLKAQIPDNKSRTKDYVTGEDVIKGMRARGHQI